jgi:hypothetical protein
MAEIRAMREGRVEGGAQGGGATVGRAVEVSQRGSSLGEGRRQRGERGPRRPARVRSRL